MRFQSEEAGACLMVNVGRANTAVGAFSQNTDMWPLHVTWLSSQHGDRVLRVSFPGTGPGTFYKLALTFIQNHFGCILFIKNKSL